MDWSRLPDDIVVKLLSSLNHRDRANLAATSRTWRKISMSPCLWQSLDLRAHKCEAATASSLASRCENLKKLRFRGHETAEAIINLNARGLREIGGDLRRSITTNLCRNITDTTLTLIAARHAALEVLQLGSFRHSVSSDAIIAIATSCPNLRKLRLSGIRDIDGHAINALAKHCLGLIEIAFVDCEYIDEVAVSNVVSLRFLSVAGTTRVNWGLVSQHWTKLPNLKGLDVSRTNITRSDFSMLLSSSENLKVLCAFRCPDLEEGDDRGSFRGKSIIAFFTDIFKNLASLIEEITPKESNVFSDWRNMKKKDKNVDEIMTWVEWILSYSLLCIADLHPRSYDNFWLSQGAALLLNLLQSSQEDVQERTATVLSTFADIVNENARVDGRMAEAVLRGGGVRLLFNLARSWREGLQSEATKVTLGS